MDTSARITAVGGTLSFTLIGHDSVSRAIDCLVKETPLRDLSPLFRELERMKGNISLR